MGPGSGRGDDLLTNERECHCAVVFTDVVACRMNRCRDRSCIVVDCKAPGDRIDMYVHGGFYPFMSIDIPYCRTAPGILY